MHRHFFPPKLKVEDKGKSLKDSLSWWKWMWLDRAPLMGTVWQACLYPVKQQWISQCLTEYRCTKMTLLNKCHLGRPLYSAGLLDRSAPQSSTEVFISMGIGGIRCFGSYYTAVIDLWYISIDWQLPNSYAVTLLSSNSWQLDRPQSHIDITFDCIAMLMVWTRGVFKVMIGRNFLLHTASSLSLLPS